MPDQLSIDMSFKEIMINLFDVSWMSEHELITICDAAEMYANGRLKHFATWLKDADKNLTINQAIDKYKEWLKTK